jgi:hypothetical protein
MRIGDRHRRRLRRAGGDGGPEQVGPIDPISEWFKAQGPGYQIRINAVLKAYRDASV